MGFKFRKSKKILPGVRLNFSKRGMGVSFGGKHARYSISPTGRRTTSVKIAPGLTYSTSSGGKRRKRKSRAKSYSVARPTHERKQASPMNLPIVLIIAGLIFGLWFLSAKLIGGVVISVAVIAFGVYLLPIKWDLLFTKDKYAPQLSEQKTAGYAPNVKQRTAIPPQAVKAAEDINKRSEKKWQDPKKNSPAGLTERLRLKSPSDAL